MRHSRIAKSNRHKKFKSVNNLVDNDLTVNEIKIKNLSEQTVSRKWTQIMEIKSHLKDKSKQNRKKKKKNKIDLIRVTTESEPIEKGMTRSDKELPKVIEQGLYESESHFMSRLSKLSAKARAEATIEDRFDVDFSQRLDTNEDKLEDKPKKTKTKTIKQKMKKINKKQKKQNNNNKRKDNSFGHLSDRIQFGERVDEPPVLQPFKKKILKK